MDRHTTKKPKKPTMQLGAIPGEAWERLSEMAAADLRSRVKEVAWLIDREWERRTHEADGRAGRAKDGPP